MDKALALTSDIGIFNYCGLDVQKHFYFDKADRVSDENVSGWSNQIKEVFQEKVLCV
jgi:NAD(P)H dehydrogenase (quinone)